MGAKV
jgi:hypothetical protein